MQYNHRLDAETHRIRPVVGRNLRPNGNKDRKGISVQNTCRLDANLESGATDIREIPVHGACMHECPVHGAK